MTKQIEMGRDLLCDGDLRRIDRRDMLKLGAVGIVGSLLPLLPAQSAFASHDGSWRVHLFHGHTGERFDDVYRVGDRYLPEACKRLNYFMRDFRTREAFPMDPHVIDIISIIQSKIHHRDPIKILSGYRSPKTNAMLRRSSTGVAKNSYHMHGQAIDICLPGYSTRKLNEIARSLKAGGVGYYPESGFVHVDTGKVRSW